MALHPRSQKMITPVRANDTSPLLQEAKLEDYAPKRLQEESGSLLWRVRPAREGWYTVQRS